MAGAFEYSSTKPRTLGAVLLGVGALFLAIATPLLVYGFSLPSTMENEMRPFIFLLCGLMIGGCGVAMTAIGARLRFFPSRTTSATPNR